MAKILAPALLALILAAFAAPAGAAPKVELRKYAFDVTGVQVTDWQHRSAGCGSSTAPCDQGSGTQTIGWSTPRPLVLDAQVITGKVPGMAVTPFALLGPRRPAKVRATVDRKVAATHQDPPPACEGSSDDCLFVPLPGAIPQDCGRRALKVDLSVTQAEDPAGLDVRSTVAPEPVYANCAPDSGAYSPTYDLAAPLDVRFAKVASRLKKLRRGQRIKLHDEQRVDCPLPQAVDGFARCVTTDVTVEVTRRR